MNAVADALQQSKIEFTSIFGIDDNKKLAAFTLRNVQIKQMHVQDIRMLDLALLDDTDVFQFSPPCVRFSASGNGDGGGNLDIELLNPCFQYIAKKQPAVWVYENVARVKSKKFEIYVDKLLRKARKVANSAYHVHEMILNAFKVGGVPNSRNRYYVVGIKRVCVLPGREFKTPGNIPMQKLAHFIDMDNFGDSLPSDRVGVRNLLGGFKKIVSSGGNPLKESWFIDRWASPSRQYAVKGICPCITSSRGSQGGFWLTRQNRMTDVDELLALMRFQNKFQQGRQAFGSAALGKAVGNSINVTVLQRILMSALHTVGLS